MNKYRQTIKKHAVKKDSPAAKISPGRSGAKRSARKPTSDSTIVELTARLKRQVKIQKALYEVANAASAVTDLQSFYGTIHGIVRTLMYAENFFVLLYDADTNTRSYVYYADSKGGAPPPAGPVAPQSLIAEVLSHPHTVHLKRGQAQDALRRGQMFGTPSEDFVGVPLTLDNRVGGGIIVSSYIKGVGYSEQDIRVLEFVARHITIALTRARAIQETRQRSAELAVINSVQEGLASKLDMQAIYDLVGDKIREILHGADVGIRIHDPKTNLIHFPYTTQNGRRIKIESLPLGEQGFGASVMRTGKTLVVNENMAQVAAKYGSTSLAGAKDPKSQVLVPLLVGDKARGLIEIVDVEREQAFSNSDVRLLETLASSMSVALENARLFDETQRLLKETEQRAAELAIINSVQEGLASKLDMQAIYDLIGDKIRKIFDAHAILINTYDHATGTVETNYFFNEYKRDYHGSIPFTRFARYLIDTRQLVVFNDNFERRHAEIGMDAPPGLTKMPKSGVWAPLIVGNTVRGVVSVYNNDRENAFNQSDIRLLQTLANSMSMALENARLFDELQRRNEELAEALEQQTALSQVLNVISSSAFELKPVFETIVEQAAVLCEAEHAWAGRLTEGGILLDAYRGPSEEIAREVGTVRSLTDPLRQATAQTLNLDDAVSHPIIGGTLLVQMARMRGFLFVPLRRDGKDIGAIIVARSQPGRFTDRQVRLIETFAAQAVIAIENVRLFTETQRLLEETEQRNAELQVINSVQEGLASRLEIQAIYDLVGDKLREIFPGHDVTINTYDHAKRLKHYHYSTERGRRDPISSRPMNSSDDYFIRLRGPRLINENMAELLATQFPDVQPYFGDFPQSYLSAPMMQGGKVGGYISLQNVDRENAFGDSDVRLLQTLANSMSVALENARLWEQETLYRKALQRELEIGREIQAGFLPETLPLVEGWEIAAALMPAREVAGDFYDAFELPGGNIGLVIADVCDKGVGAALFMTLIRSLIRITSNQDHFERGERAYLQLSAADRIRRAMSLTNSYIAESHERSGMFATLFFGILDPRNGKLTYANGGHEPPYLIRAGGAPEVLRRTGSAVGAIRDTEFGLLETQLQAGDVFFAYTDGVPDCQGPDGEFFGHERLVDLLQGARASSHELVETIEGKLHEFANGATQFDDITLLTVRRAGE